MPFFDFNKKIKILYTTMVYYQLHRIRKKLINGFIEAQLWTRHDMAKALMP